MKSNVLIIQNNSCSSKNYYLISPDSSGLGLRFLSPPLLDPFFLRFLIPLTIAIRSFIDSLAWSIFPLAVRATFFSPKFAIISSSDIGFSSSYLESSSLLLLLCGSWFLIISRILAMTGSYVQDQRFEK